MAISSKLLNTGERVVVDTRTHPKALIGPVFWLVVLLAVAVVVQVLVGQPVLALVVWVLAVIGILWLFVRPLLVWLTATYTITDRRLITRHGVLTRRGHDIPLSRVSDVEYERDLIDRVLGCGTLLISDASTGGEVVLHDIPDVEETQRILDALLYGLHTGRPGRAADEGV